MALRPAGGVLGVDVGDLARHLVELELRIEAEGEPVPLALRAERDEVLRGRSGRAPAMNSGCRPADTAETPPAKRDNQVPLMFT